MPGSVDNDGLCRGHLARRLRDRRHEAVEGRAQGRDHNRQGPRSRRKIRSSHRDAARKGNRDRIEVQHQPAPPGTAEGTERYFAWSVYVPKKLSDASHSLGYFETRNTWSQLMAFEVNGEDILFTTRVPYRRHSDG